MRRITSGFRSWRGRLGSPPRGHLVGAAAALAAVVITNWYFGTEGGQHLRDANTLLGHVLVPLFVTVLLVYFSLVVSSNPIAVLPLLLMYGFSLYYQSSCMQLDMDQCLIDLGLTQGGNPLLAFLRSNFSNPYSYLFFYLVIAVSVRLTQRGWVRWKK